MNLKLETKADLEALHANQIIESNSLEYKASAAVENTDARKTEIAKDVSAMANANGGQFVYGMAEAKYLPAGLDEGIPPHPCNGLWFEQVIQQNVRPPIEGLHILPIPAGNGNNYYVIAVPPSRTVHQVKDGRYFRRRNFRNDVMEDYEIREAMNRSTTPEPFVEISLPAENTELVWPDPNSHSTPVKLTSRIGNRSTTPALYTYVNLYLDADLVVNASGGENIEEAQTTDGSPIQSISFMLVTPHHFPLIKEKSFRLGNGISIAISNSQQLGDMRYRIGYQISTAGYTQLVTGYFIKRGSQISLHWLPW